MSKIENSSQGIRYKTLIIIVSIVIPVVVLILFNIRITSLPPLTFLPPIYASINGITALLLIAAFSSIKKKKIKQHEMLMKTSIFLSLVFLVMYILYHIVLQSTKMLTQAYVLILKPISTKWFQNLTIIIPTLWKEKTI